MTLSDNSVDWECVDEERDGAFWGTRGPTGA